MIVRQITAVIAVLYLALGTSAKAVAQDWIYLAVKGDTLWDLCIQYSNKRGCWIELGKYNHIVNDRRIPTGSEIRFPLAWLREIPVVGKVASVRGEVFYFTHAVATKAPLAAGQPLLLGSRIVTGDGTARITLGDHSTLLVRPQSELELNSLSTGREQGQAAELSLDQGGVEIQVEPRSKSRFEVKTPSAIAAVRGTRYRVALQNTNDASTRNEVLTGSVEVQAGTSLLVPAGFGVLAQKGKALDQPRKLLAPPVFEQTRVSASLPVHIAWQSDPDAVAWRLDVLATGAAAQLLASHRLGEPEIELTDLDEACYQIVLRAIDADGFNGLESRLPVCIIARLPAPTNITIGGAGHVDKPYRLAWSPIAGAAQYRLEVATDPGFEHIISSQLVGENAALVSVDPVRKFYIRVAALDENDNSGLPSAIVEHHERNYLPALLKAALFTIVALL